MNIPREMQWMVIDRDNREFVYFEKIAQAVTFARAIVRRRKVSESVYAFRMVEDPYTGAKEYFHAPILHVNPVE